MDANKKKLIFSIVIVLVLVTAYVFLSPYLGAEEEYNPATVVSLEASDLQGDADVPL